MTPLAARLLVFGTSAAVLVLEIVAGRLMAPYIGVSLETFTGIIGVVLAGIALGAWAGGVAADRTEPGPLVGPLIAVSGVFVVVAPQVVDFFGPTMRAAGPLEIVFLTTAAFFIPSATLSAVTPVIVKLRLRSLDETGSVVGSFSAIGTIGGLAGTFLTGFVLLSAAPSRPLVLGMGVLLVVLGGAMAVRTMGARTVVPAVLLTMVGAGGALAAEGPCEYYTSYFCARIEVAEDDASARELWLDNLLHAYVDLDDPAHLDLRYSLEMADVIATLPEGPIDAAFIGGGGFSLPRYVNEVRPGSRSTVLEIDGALVDLVEGELGLQPSEDLEVVVDDARLSLRQEEDDAFDLVVGDAFGSLSVPWHLTTREFIGEIDRVMRPGGIYVVNVIDYPPLAFVEAEVATLFEVFDHVAVIAPLRYLTGESGGNFVLVASDAPLEVGAVQAALAERGLTEVMWAGEQARAFAGGARVLRDDYAPVDQLIGRP
ncbi:MAG: fused MFS/spermidine synthase [Dehalococcoidia bacterium]|nr:fused MFS/spermidine synthase [Dehalococcoidia bacterium]